MWRRVRSQDMAQDASRAGTAGRDHGLHVMMAETDAWISKGNEYDAYGTLSGNQIMGISEEACR